MPKLPSIAEMAAELAMKAKKPSKAESIAMGLYHPIGGGKKLKRPISEMGIKSIDNPDMPLVPHKTIKFEEMLGGAGVPLTVDRSGAGKLIQEVGGKPLIRDVPTQGGIDYTRWNEAFASLPNVANRYGTQIKEASKMKGVDPDKIYGLSNLMSHTGIDFSHQPMEVLLNQFDPTLLDKKRVKEFNTAVQNEPVVNQKTKNVTYPFMNFSGIETPEGRQELLQTSNYGGELRKNVMHKMNLDDFADMQFPSIAEARAATTEPRIMEAPTGTVGHNVARFNPEGIVTYETDKPHYSYTGVIQSNPTLGGYAGEAEQTMPMKDIFQQYFDVRRALNKPEASDMRALSMSIPIQKFDQEWLDRVKKAQEAQDMAIKTGSYKDGGQVQSFDKGGKPTVSIEGVNYEPDSNYTDPMGAVVPSMDSMKYALSQQNAQPKMTPMQQSEPYRDPKTGAIIENSMEALPPGSNVPKVGGMTPIDWNNLPQEQKKPSIGDKIAGVVEAGTTLGTGLGVFMGGLPYAMGKGLITGANPEETLSDIMQKYTYIPRSQSGVENLESIGKVLEASKLPPIMPELHGLEPAISAGSKALLKKGINAPVGASIKDVSGFSPKDEFGFYSKLEKESKNLQRKQGNGQAFMNDLMKLGVKPHELEATGMGEFLKNNNKLTKEDVQGFAERNRPVMNEIYLGKELPPLKLKEVSDKNSQARELFDIPDFNPQRYNYGTYDINANNQSVGKIFETEDNNYYVHLPDIANEGPFITKQEALDFVKQRLEHDEIGKAKHESHYRTPGGENYRELLIQAPNQQMLRGTKAYDDIAKRMYGKDFVSLPMEERHNVANIANSKQYTEGHYQDYPNTMINMRMDDRIDVEGKKGTLLDELQSDWHQEGKEKGYASDNPFLKMPQMSADEMLLKHGDQMNPEQKRYLENFIKNWERVENNNQSDEIKQKRLDERTEDFQRWVEKQKIDNAIPDAPYKNNWHELGLKKAIQHAVERGDDRLYLPTGNTLADRYDLSKQINELSYKPLNDKFYTDNLSEKYYLISATDKNGKIALHQQVTESELSNTVGKDLAKKIIDGEGEADNFGNKTFTGLDLKVGGEGMRKYYDEIYPSYLKKFAKKYGGHVGETEIYDFKPQYFIGDDEKKIMHYASFDSKKDAEDFLQNSSGSLKDYGKVIEYPRKKTKTYYYEPSEEAIAKIKGGLPYKKGGIVKMADGGSVMETEIAKMKEFIAKKKIEDELSGMDKRSSELRAYRPYESLTDVKPVTPEQVNAEYQARQAKPTVGLRPTDVGGSRIPSTQLELFKKKGGKVVSLDEMRYELMRKRNA